MSIAKRVDDAQLGEDAGGQAKIHLTVARRMCSNGISSLSTGTYANRVVWPWPPHAGAIWSMAPLRGGQAQRAAVVSVNMARNHARLGTAVSASYTVSTFAGGRLCG